MTAAVEGGEWSAARPDHILPPRKSRYPFYRTLGGLQGRSLRAKNLVHIGIGSRTLQPVVIRYTDWATGPTHTHTHTHTHVAFDLAPESLRVCWHTWHPHWGLLLFRQCHETITNGLRCTEQLTVYWHISTYWYSCEFHNGFWQCDLHIQMANAFIMYPVTVTSVCLYRGKCEGRAALLRVDKQRKYATVQSNTHECNFISRGKVKICTSSINSRSHVSTNRASFRSGFSRNEPHEGTKICSHSASLAEQNVLNTSNAQLNPICHFLALLGAHHILHVSTLRVLLLRWRYSPGWALPSFTLHLQASRSLALSLHSFIPIFLRSVDTSSIHLILGLPLRLVAYSFPYILFFSNSRFLAFFLYDQAIVFFGL